MSQAGEGHDLIAQERPPLQQQAGRASRTPERRCQTGVGADRGDRVFGFGPRHMGNQPVVGADVVEGQGSRFRDGGQVDPALLQFHDFAVGEVAADDAANLVVGTDPEPGREFGPGLTMSREIRSYR